jgi:cyclopropane-fatty-acyl-phospholipid synthase
MVQGIYSLDAFLLGTITTNARQIWELFLAWSVIASRQGSATCYQMVVVKNLNSTHRINGVSSQYGLAGALAASKAAGKNRLP